MSETKRGGGAYLTMFGVIGVLFITILVVAYHYANKANPVMLDEHGRVPQSQHS
jgi:hypothetical protein